MAIEGKNVIGFGSTGEGTYTFRAYNPTLGAEVDPEFHEASPEEVERTMQLAEQAFHIYRKMPAAKRADFLERAAEEIENTGEALIERCQVETALPEARLIGERGRTVGQIRMFADLIREGSWVDARIDQADPEREPLPKPDTRLTQMPVGPVVVFGASNFPLAFSVAGGDTASALAAGCSVVVKAHRSHPGSGELVGRAVQKAAEATGMPEGVFAVLHGRGRKVGEALVKHPATKAVGFTGSQAGGRALFDLAAARPEPIPVYAEMGSLNPVFVLPGALAERGEAIADGLMQSVTLGGGQFCTNPGLVLGLEGADLDRFLETASGLFAEVAPATMLNAGICEAYHAGVTTLEGASDVQVVNKSDTAPDPGRTEAEAFVFSTDVETFLGNPDLNHEVFGPSTLVVTCGSKADMERVARGLEGHLTATLHGTEADMADHQELISILEQKVGRLLFNGFPTGVEVCSSMHHGGPYPATTDGRSTSVGTAAIFRFCRLVCYQNFPQNALPAELQDANPLGIWRLVDNKRTRDTI
ncbi:MAG: aldehyde dehydrogenase (NADP(+)) [bacterium]|nr:aldehyde dehydrogenase (NADP(+)) [bacterium]